MKLITGHWNELQAMAAPVRTEVFVREQGVPQELEWDLEDLSALHAVVIDDSGRAIATARLLKHAPGIARIGRMAVLSRHRSQGLGRRLLLTLMQAARDRGHTSAPRSSSQTAFRINESRLLRRKLNER